ncbi:MAG: hypothetical protein RL477_75, partial [Pseudomonadota bacterium]
MSEAATSIALLPARRAARRVLAALLAAIFVLGPCAAARADKPQRIVSINLCTDQLAMLLVPAERIVSLSFLAADPASSAMAELGARFHLNHGLAEEILPLDPDIVLAGPHGAGAAIALLRRLGRPVFQ